LRNPIVSFAANNTLITPSGIWSIEQEKLVACPSLILEPPTEEPSMISHTCFSHHAGARIIDEASLEVFAFEEPDGSYEFRLTHRVILPLDEESGSGKIYALRGSGEKIVVGRLGITWYVVIRDGTADFVELAEFRSIILSAHFTKSAQKIIGTLLSCDSQATTVVLWSLNDVKGNPVHADQLQLFKCHDTRVQFSLITSSNEREEGAMILTSSGDVHRLDFLTP